VQASKNQKLILLTGATGYVGSQLMKALMSSRYRIRCLARKPKVLYSRAPDITDIVQGDVLNRPSLDVALKGIHTAFYLIHSMASNGDFAEIDSKAAENFAGAAKEAGVKRIIYLGGLGGEGELSPHLASRQEVGKILRDSGILTLEFRASIIIGSGSLSFEMIRTLVEKLPIMITPRWVQTLAQPIAIEDIIAYLAEAIEIPLPESHIFEIGGPDQVSYQEIMKEYARQRDLGRLMIPVPVLTPYLSSLWLGLVTPLYVQIGRTLIESIKNPTVVHDCKAKTYFSVQPRSIGDAIRQALNVEDQEFIHFRAEEKTSAVSTTVKQETYCQGSRIFDMYSIMVSDTPEQAFKPIRRIGGKIGWYYANWLWQFRGLIDKLLGGVGLRRSRRDSDHMQPGDVVDFWRVESYEPNRLLRLRAEMKLPGRAWLQFEVVPHTQGSIIYQTAIFDPHGLAGRLYWFGLYPIHRFLFKRMLKHLVKNIGNHPLNS
jgi:uncharacterized protein YbjT (DUF2867 family)